jgi:hypothetical protein
MKQRSSLAAVGAKGLSKPSVLLHLRQPHNLKRPAVLMAIVTTAAAVVKGCRLQLQLNCSAALHAETNWVGSCLLLLFLFWVAAFRGWLTDVFTCAGNASNHCSIGVLWLYMLPALALTVSAPSQ